MNMEQDPLYREVLAARKRTDEAVARAERYARERNHALFEPQVGMRFETKAAIFAMLVPLIAIILLALFG